MGAASLSTGGVTRTAAVGEWRRCRPNPGKPCDSQQAVAIRWPGVRRRRGAGWGAPDRGPLPHERLVPGPAGPAQGGALDVDVADGLREAHHALGIAAVPLAEGVADLMDRLLRHPRVQ